MLCNECAEASCPALSRLNGCASVSAVPTPAPGINSAEHFLNVYIAEAASPGDSAAIVNGAAARGGREGSEVLGLADGQIFAIAVAACTMYGQPSFETATTMTRFSEMITPLLEG